MNQTILRSVFSPVIATSVAASLALSSCATVNPYYVSPAEKEARTTYEDTPTYANARDYARKLQNNYYSSISSNALLSSATALTAITLSSILAYNAITSSGGTSSNAALAVGGAGMLSTYQFLYSKPRMAVYAAGAAAMSCVLSAFVPLTAAHTILDASEVHIASLTDANKKLELDIKAAETQLKAAVNKPIADADKINSAKEVLAEGEATVVEAEAAVGIVKSAGESLYAAADSVRAQTVRELLKSEVDMQAFVTGLGTSIPFGVGQLPKAPQNAQTPVAGNTAGKNDAAALQTALAKMEASAADVVRLKKHVATFLGVVRQTPSPERVKACAADIKLATPLLKVGLERTDIEIGRSASITILDGRFPYTATWVGQLPNNKVVKTMSYEGAKGIVTVEVQTGAQTGTYNLVVDDVTGATVTAFVTIKDAAPAAPAANTAAPQTASDPLIKEIQENLIKRGFTDADVTTDGVTKKETLTADGKLGPITTAVLAKYYADQGLKAEDFDLQTEGGKKALLELLKPAT